MQVQRELGSDIVMVFDECTPYPATEKEAGDSMELSLRWAKRSRDAHTDNPSALFGIVQGGMYTDLRKRSLQGLEDIGFEGYALGGLSVGEPKDEREKILTEVVPEMPESHPLREILEESLVFLFNQLVGELQIVFDPAD